MKRLAIIWKLLLIPLFAGAQFPLDDLCLKIDRVVEYQGRTEHDGSFTVYERASYIGESLMYINDGEINNLNGEDRLKRFRFIEIPEYANPLVVNHEWPGYYVEVKDAGALECVISIYEKSPGNYMVVAEYPNWRFAWHGTETTERPWDNKPIDYVAEGMKYRTNPDYTAEELERFADKMSDFFGQTITSAMMISWSWNSLME